MSIYLVPTTMVSALGLPAARTCISLRRNTKDIKDSTRFLELAVARALAFRDREEEEISPITCAGIQMEDVLWELNQRCSRGNWGNHYCTTVSDYAKSAEEKFFKWLRRRTEGNTVRNEVMPWLRSRNSSMCKITNVLGCSATNPK